jgi:hypothetical protein
MTVDGVQRAPYNHQLAYSIPGFQGSGVPGSDGELLRDIDAHMLALLSEAHVKSRLEWKLTFADCRA